MNDDEPIVVGVDGSATSVYALRWAAEEGERLGLPVHAVLAVPSPREPTSPDQADRNLDLAIDKAFAPDRRRLRQRVTARVMSGRPVEVLIERSRSAALLVLGRAMGIDPLHTSVMAQCLRRAACPVAVVPASTPSPDTAEAAAPSTAQQRQADLSKQPLATAMQRRVLGVTATTGVDVALQLMVGAGIHHLPVTEHGRCIGLLHESDLVWRMAAWPFTGNPPPAEDVARKPPPVVPHDHTIGDAAAVMFDTNSDAVLVTDDRNVVGILTTNDMLGLLANPDSSREQTERRDRQ
ncbi:MAG TPA: CBS domain-containing protein [Actinopolymorphaceae bacterium]|nr:CBS domain-containing protein [Actinopolymorphaceae bacterium]